MNTIPQLQGPSYVAGFNLKTFPGKQVRELLPSDAEVTEQPCCQELPLTPARVLCLHVLGPLLPSPTGLQFQGYRALRSLSVQCAGLTALPPVRHARTACFLRASLCSS